MCVYICVNNYLFAGQEVPFQKLELCRGVGVPLVRDCISELTQNIATTFKHRLSYGLALKRPEASLCSVELHMYVCMYAYVCICVFLYTDPATGSL